MNIVADQVHSVIDHSSVDSTILGHRAFVICVFAALVIVPLCMLRRIESLQFTSILAVFAICILEIDVVYHSIKLGTVSALNTLFGGGPC